MSQVPALSLHENNFGPHFIIFPMDEETAWNPKWQVWIMLAWIVENLFATALEGRPEENCNMNLGLN